MGHEAGGQWFGFRDRIFANKILKIEFWIKFVGSVPPKGGNFGMKVYGVLYDSWISTCSANLWCKVSMTVKNRNSGDGDHVILIFDSINRKQVIRVAQFKISVLKGN